LELEREQDRGHLDALREEIQEKERQIRRMTVKLERLMEESEESRKANSNELQEELQEYKKKHNEVQEKYE